MIGAGADLRATSPNGTTVLMVAAEQGRPKVVELLLAAGVAVDARDREGRTALMRAAGVDPRMASTRHVSVVRQLLAAKADRSLRDRQGRTAADLARKAGNWLLVDALKQETPPRSMKSRQ
jgi:ankyrin repeat protein